MKNLFIMKFSIQKRLIVLCFDVTCPVPFDINLQGLITF
jgi:hypothetical protein